MWISIQCLKKVHHAQYTRIYMHGVLLFRDKRKEMKAQVNKNKFSSRTWVRTSLVMSKIQGDTLQIEPGFYL